MFHDRFIKLVIHLKTFTGDTVLLNNKTWWKHNVTLGRCCAYIQWMYRHYHQTSSLLNLHLTFIKGTYSEKVKDLDPKQACENRPRSLMYHVHMHCGFSKIYFGEGGGGRQNAIWLAEQHSLFFNNITCYEKHCGVINTSFDILFKIHPETI